MSSNHRFFLVAESLNNGYPNFENSKVNFQKEDPAFGHNDKSYVCSPLFSIHEQGTECIPLISEHQVITFAMVPNIFPTFGSIIREFNFTNEVWFSLGLANLIIIEDNSSNLSKEIIAYLAKQNNITAYEKWELNNGVIKKNSSIIHFTNPENTAYHFNVNLSESLPLDVRFAVSEYSMSVDKILTASKRFTPFYYQKHLKTISNSYHLVEDLCFLYGDQNIEPNYSLLNALGVANKEEARDVLINGKAQRKKDELLNDRHGRLIQFNSSLSYVYSQTYSGTFPLFDHIGIIRRHSLLGVGSAIGALFELIIQLEEALYFLPFENVKQTLYQASQITNLEYFKSFIEAALHDQSAWKNDNVASTIIDKSDPSKLENLKLPDNFFSRLSFFSGRLGFREYDLSATAAVHVLVSSPTLKWNIINYTHEIIHNHVRIILNHIVSTPFSLRNEKYNIWLQRYIDMLESVLNDYSRQEIKTKIGYSDYFTLLIVKFCINSTVNGSLSQESNVSEAVASNSLINQKNDFILPTIDDLRELLILRYKDITEIFVHVIDYSYIYIRNVEIYVQSIWASWATVASVTNDLKQYIIRTLLVISLNISGNTRYRFEQSKQQFIAIIEKFNEKLGGGEVFVRIKAMLIAAEDWDLRLRFYNCMVIADMVYHFFTGKIETFLDNKDRNVFNDTGADGLPVIYNVATNSFDGYEIQSKVRLVLDQLIKTIQRDDQCTSEGEKEKTSAWLLLSLSSHSK